YLPSRSHLVTLYCYYFFCHTHVDHRDLPSFPTRRSSDLGLSQPDPLGRGIRPQLPIRRHHCAAILRGRHGLRPWLPPRLCRQDRSEEHTSELQSRFDLVCRLLLEKKKAELLETRV